MQSHRIKISDRKREREREREMCPIMILINTRSNLTNNELEDESSVINLTG